MGRRPELKSDEFRISTEGDTELNSLLCLKPPKQVVQLLAARPQATMIFAVAIQDVRAVMMIAADRCPYRDKL